MAVLLGLCDVAVTPVSETRERLEPLAPESWGNVSKPLSRNYIYPLLLRLLNFSAVSIQTTYRHSWQDDIWILRSGCWSDNWGGGAKYWENNATLSTINTTWHRRGEKYEKITVAYKIFFGNIGEKVPLMIIRHKCEDNNKIGIKQAIYEYQNWIQLALGRVPCRNHFIMIMNLLIQ
jgi:hypothetical protein